MPVRRKPAQQRSRDVVATLIEATAQTIAQRGLDGTTTNHIAARAGVSVGTIYQYFNNKEELVGALLDKLVEDLAHIVDRGVPHFLDSDLQTTVRGLLHTAFELFESNEKLYLELARNWHRLDTQRALRSIERHMQEVFRLYALRHYREMHVKDLSAAVFVMTNSSVFTILRYLSLPHEPFSREKLVDELTRMLAGYLGGEA